MNIPEETDRRYGKPEDCNDVEIAMRLGFRAGAKWARKEALREAAAAFYADSAGNGVVGWNSFTVAEKLNALADGDPS
jgi:hypothetical protein